MLFKYINVHIMDHPFEYYEVEHYKLGQLITADHIIYRCEACKSWSGCEKCEIKKDMNHKHVPSMHYYKICVKCGLFTTFKRLSK